MEKTQETTEKQKVETSKREPTPSTLPENTKPKADNQVTKTEESALQPTEGKTLKRPRRDRPDRPRRSRNPHRNPNNKTNSSINKEEAKESKEKSGETKTNHTSSKKSNGNKNNTKNRRGKNTHSLAPLRGDIKEALRQNKIANEARMQPWKQIDISNKHKVRFTPLGGLGEIGGNIAVIEDDESAIIIDVGMSFPDETMHGVDILVPDFSYLHAIKSKIKGIVITHAHEDHIGAVPYLFKELKFPIYGTPLTLAMIENKFQEHKLKDDIKYFNYIVKRKVYDIGTFKVEWIHMTHSIVDACGLAIQTKAGTLLHTADFKIDHTPIDGLTTDLQRYAYYGSKGVLCLFSDSTNSHNPGFTKSEAVVGRTFDTLFDLAKGRIIMSTFSSNTHRIFQAMERAVVAGRKLCVIGRSMERNIEIARRLGFVNIENKHFIDPHEVNHFADNEVLVITTGSQGEEMAALSRMATDEHRHIKLKPTDTVIISAHAIPGNEGSVSSLMNKLVKIGVTVRYKDFEDIHVSGHAAQEEQKLILRLVQPKFFLPVHGEYNHIAKHAQTAISCGVPERNILLMSDGDQVEITTRYIKKVKTVKTGKSFIDNQNNKEIKADVVSDRQKLAEDGIVNIALQVRQSTQKMVGKPAINNFGLIPNKDTKRFNSEVENIIETYLLHIKPEQLNNTKKLQEELRVAIYKHIVRTRKRYPIIVLTIFIV